MTRADWRAIVVVLLALALTMFAGEAIHELHYAGAHPSGYGPANVIALACAAGAVLALAAGIAIFVAPPTTAMPRWCVPAVLVAIGLGVWLVTVSAAVPESSSLGTFPYNDGSPLGN